MSFIDLFINPAEPKQPDKKEDKQQKAETNQTATVPINPQNFVSQTVTADMSIPAGGQVDNELLGQMLNMLAEKNLPGPDLLEVKNFSTAFKDSGLPQEKQYESTAKMLKMQHPDFTKEHLLESIDIYIGYVNEEIKNCQSEFESKKREVIGGREKSISDMQKRQEEIAEQIRLLNEESARITSDITRVAGEIETSSKELDSKMRTFIDTANRLKADLERDKSLMQNIEF